MSRSTTGRDTTARKWRARILIADADPSMRAWLREALGDRHRVQEVDSAAMTLRTLAEWPAHVLIVGNQLADMPGARLLAHVRQLDERGQLCLFVAESEPGQHVPAPEDEAVFYVLNRLVPKEDVLALVGSAIERYAPHLANDQEALSSPDDAARIQRILEFARRLALQRDLGGATRVTVSAVSDLAAADRAYCLYYDRASGALWSEGADNEFEGTAASGIAGFAARTGTSIYAPRAANDSRYDRRVDDPAGRGNERLLAQPIRGPDGQVHAVLVAVRGVNEPEFDDATRAMVASLAEQTGPLLHQLALQVEAQSVLDDATAQAAGTDGDLFRREAIEAHLAHRKHGDVVRISPAWVRWSYWLIAAILLVGGAYLFIGRMGEYSRGSAVVRMTGRTEITARDPGSIERVAVTQGEHVDTGQLLVRLHGADEIAELERMRDEFDDQLAKYLRNPSDKSIGTALSTLRGQKERAEKRLEELEYRAPHAGTVSDLRIRVGQHLSPGEVIMSIISNETELSVIAFMPGRDRPQLHPGQTMRIALDGYRDAYQDLTIDSVQNDVIGPAEARRYLPVKLADTVPIMGPVVLVRSQLPTTDFTSDGTTFQYHDGMSASAEVRMRTRRIIEVIIPGLKDLW